MRETDEPNAELNGQDFAERFSMHLSHHRTRILTGFGTDKPLPILREKDALEELTAAEKRFNKALDLLYREGPLPEAEMAGQLTVGDLNRVTDNLAWRSLETMLIANHLRVLTRIKIRLEEQGRRREAFEEARHALTERIGGLKANSVFSNHWIRDFFSGALAKDPNFQLSSPAVLEKVLREATVIDDPTDVAGERAGGISLEIAGTSYLEFLAEQDPEINRTAPIVVPGDVEQDLIAGDAVVLRGEEPVFIDFKNHRPPGQFTEDELEKHRRLRFVGDHWKAMVWGESAQPVADDRFRLTDIALRNALRGVMIETAPAIAN